MKKYVYFGGIEHSIRKEVRLITQETTKLFCEDIKIIKAPLELSEIIFSQDLYQRTMQCQAVQFYLRSVHVDVRPCVVVATQAKSGSNGNDLEILQIQY